MNVKTPESVIKTQFRIGLVPYVVSYIFIMAGLIWGSIVDFGYGNPGIIALDIASFFIFTLSFVLVQMRRLTRSTSLIWNLIATMVVFFLSSILSVNDPRYVHHLEGNIMMALLVTGLMASVLGMAVSRTVAIIVIVLSYFYLFFVTVWTHNSYLEENIFLILLVLTGNLLVVFFLRIAVDKLVSRLRRTMMDLRSRNYNLRQLKERAESLNAMNHPYVQFGKNTSGLIHDLKNDVNILHIRSQVIDMKHKRSRPLDNEDIEELQKAVRRLISRIETVKFIANAKPSQAPEPINVHTLLESAIYPFRIADNYRNRIDFQTPYRADHTINSYRFHLLRILENLVQNSCEALMDRAHAEGNNVGIVGTISVDALAGPKCLTLVVEDDGPGIEGCFDCADENCLSCHTFEIGKTSKDYGSGYGMVNVMNLTRDLGGTIKIVSKLGRGTQAEICLPYKESPTKGAAS